MRNSSSGKPGLNNLDNTKIPNALIQVSRPSFFLFLEEDFEAFIPICECGGNQDCMNKTIISPTPGGLI